MAVSRVWFPPQEYLIAASSEEESRLLSALVDILFACAYDNRFTQGDPNAESAWACCTLRCAGVRAGGVLRVPCSLPPPPLRATPRRSPTLSWFDAPATPFDALVGGYVLRTVSQTRPCPRCAHRLMLAPDVCPGFAARSFSRTCVCGALSLKWPTTWSLCSLAAVGRCCAACFDSATCSCATRTGTFSTRCASPRLRWSWHTSGTGLRRTCLTHARTRVQIR